MAQVRVLIAHAEDLSLVPSSYMVRFTMRAYNSCPKGSDTFLWQLGNFTQCTYPLVLHTHKNENI